MHGTELTVNIVPFFSQQPEKEALICKELERVLSQENKNKAKQSSCPKELRSHTH